MKQQLPAKYAKMTVCSFWILKELKSLGMLNEEQVLNASKHFQLSESNEDQMLFYKDLVENFDEHEKYLKMFAASNRIQTEEEQDTTVDTKVASIAIKKESKKQKTEMDLIDELLDSETDSEYDSEHEKNIIEKPKIKLIIKSK
jgi:hypothetical protein